MINSLDIYRQGVKIATIDIDESTVFNGKLPGTELISCPIKSLKLLNLQEEDYIIHRGAAYKIRILPEFSKDSESLAKSYKIDFLARFYDLLDTYVQHLGAHTFPLYGDARAQLQMVIDSANLTDTGWTVGTVDVTSDKLLNYDWTFARPALDQIAEAFGLEWNAVGTTINMVASTGKNTGLTFELGRGEGLHQITRSSDTSKEKINRVYGIGGTRNIDSTYRNGQEPNLVFEERYVETPGVTAGTERVRMGKYENLEIYPRFEGIVSNPVFVTTGGKITSATIQDPNIDFDLMLILQDGVKPKVSFLTGPVTGEDFEISSFNFATKTISLVPFTDTSGYYFPSATSKPEVGNKFTFIDVRMPASYKILAENKLKAESNKFLNENKLQRLIYGVKPDEKHLRDNAIVLNCGDRAQLIDVDFGVNEILRFTEISYPLVNEFDVTGIIGNEIVYDQVVKQYAAVLNNTKQIATVTAQGIIQSKRSAQDLRALEGSIFDTEGMFDSDKFNVGVLTAVLGIFGVKSQNFVLSEVRMVDNVGGNPNAVTISGGQLIHLEITNAGAGGDTWTMTSLSVSSLLSSSFYYIYAKCSKVSQVGSWVITTDQIKPDDVAGFYNFLAGVIYPVNNGFRDSEFTYGITDITGNRIKTGIIAGRNGSVEINLETGTIKGDITFTGNSLANINNISSAANTGVANAATALGVANNAANAASNAQSSANTANTLLANIANDNILAASEKPDVLKEYNIIVGEVSIIQSQANQYSLSHSSYTANYTALINYLNPLLSAMGSDDVINGATFRQYFTNYYNEKVSLLSAISVKAKQLADAAQNSASTAINNAQIVQNNLTSIQNSLGGLAYKSAVELAQLGSTIISGGYIKTSLIETNALIISGSLATQTYAVNQASSYSNAALSSAQTYASSVATTAGNNALSAAQTYAIAQATQAKADAIANAASNAFAQSYAGGKMLYRDPEFFTGLNGISVYNNSGSGLVQISRGTDGLGYFGYNLPNATNCYVNIDVYPGAAKDPGLGGFFWNTPSRANAIYIVRLMAFIPVGYTLQWTTNPIGGGGVIYLSDPTGIGNWKEYLVVVKCGQSGIFGGTNFLYLTGPDARLQWVLASATVYDMTAVETDPLVYTDTKAIATINAAQSYADSVATSKANIAQTAAISSASADATAKANAAQSAAVAASTALVNSIQVGGVNTFSSTTGLGPINMGTVGYIKNGTHGGYPVTNGIGSTGLPTNNGEIRIPGVITSDGEWTVSGRWIANGAFTIYVDICDEGSQGFTVPTVYTDFKFTVNVTRHAAYPNVYTFVDFQGIPYVYFNISDLKIEKGNKATAWSPSIADTQAAIDLAKTTADNAVTAYNNLTSSLKSLAFQDVVELSKLGSTVINGGMLSNTLIDTNFIRTNVINAGYIQSLEIVAPSVRTGNSGVKRFEATQTTNSAILYNAANEQLVRIDDNLAVESPGNAITPATYGAGIRIGQSGATTSLSRYGLSVTSPNGDLYPKTFIGTVGSGYTGFASIDVEGGFNVKNLEHYFGGTGKGDFKLVAGNVLDYNGNQINVMLVVPL